MPGMFGSDFDVSRPEDSSAVKHGASWIRDIKARLKRFLAVMFNLETGKLKNDVVGTEMLKDLTTPGTYTQVTVNSKGLVTAGSNPVEQKSAQIFRAIFTIGSGNVEIEGGLAEAVAPTIPNDAYQGIIYQPYKQVYSSLVGANYYQYDFDVPEGVRRIKAIIIGAGGGRDTGSGNGGAGGELVEAVFDVSGLNTAIGIVVGSGGSDGEDGQPGGASSVFLSNTVYAEAGGGEGGADSAGGSPVTGGASTGVLNVLRIPGESGASAAGGDTGSYYKKYGYGSPNEAADGAGNDGLVILEWVV
jgi:hypothetical protein